MSWLWYRYKSFLARLVELGKLCNKCLMFSLCRGFSIGEGETTDDTKVTGFIFSPKVLFFWHQYRRKITNLCRVFQLLIKWLTQILVHHPEKWALSHTEKPIVLSLLTVITDPEGMSRAVLVACENKAWRNFVKKVKRTKQMLDMKFFLKIINTNLIIFLCIV